MARPQVHHNREYQNLCDATEKCKRMHLCKKTWLTAERRETYRKYLCRTLNLYCSMGLERLSDFGVLNRQLRELDRFVDDGLVIGHPTEPTDA